MKSYIKSFVYWFAFLMVVVLISAALLSNNWWLNTLVVLATIGVIVGVSWWTDIRDEKFHDKLYDLSAEARGWNALTSIEDVKSGACTGHSTGLHPMCVVSEIPHVAHWVRVETVDQVVTDGECTYETRWIEEVGDIAVCTIHENNSKWGEEYGEHRPCIAVDPW